MFRLSQGPVALTFLTGSIQRAINSNLAGYRVELADAIIELDGESRQPRLRLRNVVLLNGAGEPIARAPKAALGINGRDALLGNFVPRQLELIGARILAQRKVDGTFRLGFVDTSVAALHRRRGIAGEQQRARWCCPDARRPRAGCAIA